MANIKLKACDHCGAVTAREDEEFHTQWHVTLEARLMRLEPQRHCGCRLAEDRGDGKARGTILCSYHLKHGPPDFDDWGSSRGCHASPRQRL